MDKESKEYIETLTNTDVILSAISARFIKRFSEQVSIIQAIEHGENPNIALDENAIKEIESQLLHFKDFPLYFLTAVFQAIADCMEANNRLLLDVLKGQDKL